MKYLYILLLFACHHEAYPPMLYEESTLLEDGRVRNVRCWIDDCKVICNIDTVDR